MKTKNAPSPIFKTPHHAKVRSGFFFFSFHQKFHFNKQVIYVFLGVKNIHVREKKKRKKSFLKSFGKKKNFLGDFSRFRLGQKKKKLIQFFRSSLARAAKAFHSGFFCLIFRKRGGEGNNNNFFPRKNKKNCLKLV